MDAKAILTIRLEIEHMKHAIISHIGAYGSDMGKILDAEIQKAIENYDWQGDVTRIVHNAIQNHVKEYFTYGEGNKAICESIQTALGKVFVK